MTIDGTEESMIKIILIVVVLVAALLAYAATKPDTFHVQRSTNIKAPPEKIFALIEDLHSSSIWTNDRQGVRGGAC
jgi:hypothetical protein